MIPKKPTLSHIVILALVVSSCNVQIKEAATTPTTFVLTSTLPATVTALPTETALPPSPQPTVVSVEGISSTQINVRSEPSTVGSVVGVIPSNTKVEIVGKDPAGNWWQIIYPQGTNGRSWVTAQYLTTTGTPDVPVVGGDGVDPNKGDVAIVQQQINIRSGPGTGFNALGTLNPQDVVSLTGKDASGAWLQIAFTAGPEGKGWINAAFVQARGVESLPIVTEAGEVVGTGTPTGIPPIAAPTIMPAWADNDSPNNPIVSVIFESTGTRSFVYTGDVSSPNGDLQDWITFIPYGRTVFASLECTGKSEPKLNLSVNGLTVDTSLRCGDKMKKIDVNAGSNYVLEVQMPSSAGELVHTSYTVIVQAGP